MKNEVFLELRKRIKNNNKCISLSQPFANNEELLVEDIIPTDINLEELAETNIKIKQLYKFINELDELEQQIVLGYLAGLNTAQISSQVELSKTYINEKHRKIINKLRYKLIS